MLSLWCSKTGRLLSDLEHRRLSYSPYFFSVAFSPQSTSSGWTNLLAAGCSDGNAYLWDTCAALRSCTSTAAAAAAVSSSGNSRLPIGKLAGQSEGCVRSLVFIDCGNKLVVGSDRSIRLWDVDMTSTTFQQPLMKVDDGPLGLITSVAAVSCNKIASGSSDGTVRILDMSTGKQLLKMNGHTNSVLCVAACSSTQSSPDVDINCKGNKIVASGSCDESVRLWDTSSGQEVAKLEGHTATVNSVAFSPDGKTLASATDHGAVFVWDVSTRRPMHKFQTMGSVYAVAIMSSGGKRVVSGGRDVCRVWSF